MPKPAIRFPNNKKFAFTIFDDTDRATLKNVYYIYELLNDLDIRITKSVWPTKGPKKPQIPGTTCEDKQYLDWLLTLQKKGFEIAFHMATYHSSYRPETIRALDSFKSYFGHYPKTMANHSYNKENIYWGHYRLTGIMSKFYRLLKKKGEYTVFQGHNPNSPYFWGDVVKSRIKYVRNLNFFHPITSKMCPHTPYYDPLRPFVNYWFSTSDGSTVSMFNSLLSEKNQQKLADSKGFCIITTHFGKGFWKDGKLNTRFKEVIESLTQKDGWFVPVSTLLDFILEQRGHVEITDQQRFKLELKWLINKLYLTLKKLERTTL